MLSYEHSASELRLLGQTLGAVFRQTASAHPDQDALVDSHEQLRYSYRELDEASDELGRALMARGLQRGDRLAVWSPNRAEWVLTQLAAAKTGLVLVPVNPALRVPEAAYELRQSGTRAVLAAHSFRATSFEKSVAEARAEVPSLEWAAFFGTPSFAELLGQAAEIDAVQLLERGAEVDVDDAIAIVYTSGTREHPVGATLTHHGVVNNGNLVGASLGYTEADRVCIPIPLFHCFGMVGGNIAAFTQGAAVVLPGPSFDPGEVLAAVERERCTSLAGVPAMFQAELMTPDLASRDLTSLRLGLMGGALCPPDLVRRARKDLNIPQLAIGYGMTETSPVTAATRPDDDEETRSTSVGRPHPHVELKVVDARGRIVERGVEGELCARGYCVMRGYWDDPARTAETVDVDGWLRSGDLATMDDAGNVRITGRLKDLIIRGGENVSARAVEGVLSSHPDIDEVHVVAVPDPGLGEEVLAWVRVRPGAALTAEQVRLYCLQRMARFKVPKYVRFAETFPTANGKADKGRLREQALAEIQRG
jgi:fatty-acyl-CoA synthase